MSDDRRAQDVRRRVMAHWKFAPRQRGRGEIVGLSSVDPLDWSQPAMPYRVRFEVPGDYPLPRGADGAGPFSAAAARERRFLAEKVVPLLRGAWTEATGGVYLADLADLRRVLVKRRRFVRSVQTRAMHEEAARLGRAVFRSNADYVAMLDGMGRSPTAEQRRAAEDLDALEAAEAASAETGAASDGPGEDALERLLAVEAAAREWTEMADAIDSHLDGRSVPPDELYERRDAALRALREALGSGQVAGVTYGRR